MKKLLFAFALCVGIIAGGAARAENNCTGATYYDADTDTCIACPAGYDYNQDAGKTDVTQCQIHCDAGTYVETAGTALPDEYTMLEYIESTGTQWIDTQQKFMYGDDFYFEYMPVATYSIEDKGYGVGTPLINEITGGGRRANNDVVTMYMRQNNYTYSPTLTYSSTLGKKYVEHWEISVEYGVLHSVLSDFNGNVYSLVGAMFPQDYVSGRTVALFRDNIDYTYPSQSRIYRTWLKRANGTMAFDLFPARRNSDGIIGMYDTVSGQFFTNAGTGTFIAGSDVDGVIDGECVNVGAGYYAPASTVNFGSASNTRTACPAGTSTNGADNASECTPCAGATYNDETGMAVCKSCPAGYDYNTTAGKTDITQCQIHCDGGTWNGIYTQLEYIESTGTQWIDTGITSWDNTIEYELTLSIQQQDGGTHTYFGGYDQWNSYGHGLPGISTYTSYRLGTSFIAGGGSGGGVDIGIRNGQVGTIALKGNSISWSNGLESFFDRGNAFTSSVSPVIFAVRGGGNISEHSKFKLYGAKFWLNDTLVRNFIPARRNSDGVVGLYDMVTGQFFTNSGTGEFIAGPDVGSIGVCVNVGAGYWAAASTVNFGSASNTRTACPAGTSTNGADNASECTPCAGATYNDETGMAVCKSCPAGYDYNTTAGKTDITQCQIHCDVGTYVETGYTQLDYIESTGTQWIDTQQKFMYGDEFYFEYMPVASYSSEDKGYGSGTPLAQEITGGGRRANNDVVTMYMKNNNYAYVPTLSYTSTLGKKYTEHWKISTETGHLTSNLADEFGNTYVVSGATFDSNYTSGQTITLYRDNGAYEYPSRMRIYHTWLKRSDGTMAFDLFPARRNSDGVLGMYDTVTGTFFTNSGTGTFVAGADIGGCVNVGAGYWAPASTVNVGSVGTKNACPVGLYTVGYGHGADDANDCGRILHVGDNVIYTRRNKETTPSVNIQMPNGDMFYISLSPINHNVSRLHFSYGGNEYTAYDDSLYYGERNFDTGAQIVQ